MSQSNVVITGPNAIEGTYKNIVLKSGIGFEEQTREGYCIYHVKWNYDLGGAVVDIPANVVISMEGGVISNGTLVGHDTQIIYDVPVDKAFVNIELEGTWIDDDDKQDARISELERISGNRAESIVLPTHMGRVTLKPNVIHRDDVWFVYPYTFIDALERETTVNILVYYKDSKYYLPFRNVNHPKVITVIEQEVIDEQKLDVGTASIEDIAIALDLQEEQYMFYDDDDMVITMPDSSTVDANDVVNDNWPLKNYTETDANLLTQQMISKPNTIYVIQYDYELATDITIPENCVLKFEGGSLNNGIIVGNNTTIDAGLVKIFGLNAYLRGTWNIYALYPEWFGAVGDGVSDDTLSLQKALDEAVWRTGYGSTVANVLLKRNYKISKTLNVYPYISFGGDNSIKHDIFPYIIASNSFNGDLISLTHFTFNIGASVISIIPSSISVHNIGLQGRRYGIIKESGFSIGRCSFNHIVSTGCDSIVFFEEKDSSNYAFSTLEFKYISFEKTTNCKIPIYIHNAGYISDIHITNCTFALSKVGGVYIYGGGGVTAPIIIEKCVFDHCGNNYVYSDYLNYGSYAINVYCRTGLINIRDNYFETDCPLKKNNDAPIEGVEAKTPVSGNGGGYTYLLNPLWDKTAEIIFNGGISTTENPTLNVYNNHFSLTYQAISLINKGIVNFEDNELFIPGAAEDYYNIVNTSTFPISNSIVRIVVTDSDIFNLARGINLNIKDTNTYNVITNSDLYTYISEPFDVVGNYNPAYITAEVNMPTIDRIFKLRAGFKDTIFIDNSTENTQYLGLAYAPCKTFYQAVSRLKEIIENVEEITFFLKSDIDFNGFNMSSRQMVPGRRYKFTSSKTAKTIDLNNGAWIFMNSTLIFYNVAIRKSDVAGRIDLLDTDVIINKCSLIEQISSPFLGIIFMNEGINNVDIISSSLNIEGTADANVPFIVKNKLNFYRNKVNVFEFTNVSDVPYFKDSNDIKHTGTLGERPVDADIYTGFQYFDTNLGTAIVYAGSRGWIKQDGFTAALARGETSLRPTTQLNAADEGYQYFDTDLGKPIYFRWNGGTPQWVDATGTVV